MYMHNSCQNGLDFTSIPFVTFHTSFKFQLEKYFVAVTLFSFLGKILWVESVVSCC